MLGGAGEEGVGGGTGRVGKLAPLPVARCPHLLWGDAGRQIRQEGGLGGAAVGLCARDGVFVDGAACGGVKMLSVSWTARWGGVAEARHAGM